MTKPAKFLFERVTPSEPIGDSCMAPWPPPPPGCIVDKEQLTNMTVVRMYADSLQAYRPLRAWERDHGRPIALKDWAFNLVLLR